MELIVSIIGYGNVGKLIAALLLPYKKYSLHINIIDTDSNVRGAVLDFEHGAELYDSHSISFNSQDLLNQSDFIFHCAGASVPRGQSRLVTTKASIEITEAVFSGFRPLKTPFVIVVANPVEVISAITQIITGLPRQKVVGTGTFLDSLRMNHAVKSLMGEATTVDSVLLGEHGSTAFLSRQLSSLNTKSFDVALNQDTINELMEKVKGSASKIKETQEACIYGVSYCAIKVFEALLSVEGRSIPVSTFVPQSLEPVLGTTHAYVSLYAWINTGGVHPIEDYQPNTEELESLKKSLTTISACLPAQYV